MEILRTEVAQVTAPSGQQILRVRFCGEGGECVTVEMAHVHGVENTEAAVSRARAILVQTATFGLAANEYANFSTSMSIRLGRTRAQGVWRRHSGGYPTSAYLPPCWALSIAVSELQNSRHRRIATSPSPGHNHAAFWAQLCRTTTSGAPSGKFSGR